MPRTRLSELLTKPDRTPGEDAELMSLVERLEGSLAVAEQLIDDIKNSTVSFGHGRILTGERNVQLSKTGLTLAQGTTAVTRVNWAKTLAGTVRNYIASTLDESSKAEMYITVDGTTAWDNLMRLRVLGATSDGCWIELKDDSSQVSSITFVVFVSSTQNQVLQLLHDRMLSDYPIKIKERAASVSDDATYGQLWVKNDDPNILRYTNGDGTEFTVDVTAV